MTQKVLTIVGARPQFIKSGPVSRAFDRWNQEHPDRAMEELLFHTGQHYDYEMSDVFFEELRLRKPAFHLGVQSGSHGKMTGQILQKVEEVLLEHKPNLMIVYGDTNSTLAGALAASKIHIPIAHVEAGLRSFKKSMPEEINRVLTDHVSSLLFCPTQTAVDNLNAEGIKKGIHNVGDVMYDATHFNADIAASKTSILQDHNLVPGAYALATVHRAENTDDTARLTGILSALRSLAKQGMKVVFPIHPRTRKKMEELGMDGNGITPIPPVSYLDMLALLKQARIVLSDSGGLQKEACFVGVPCVTLRDETEWVETVQTGWNILAGADANVILQSVERVQTQPRQPIGGAFGDCDAAQKIVEIIADFLG